MEQQGKAERIAGVLLFGAGILLLMVSVYLCSSADIWYDELFTMGLSNQSCGFLISITARDVHPPLYYFIVKFFLSWFPSADAVTQVMLAKMVSVLPFGICMIYAATLIRKRFGILCAGLFSFLLCAMPNMGEYSVEIRMYSYCIWFVTAAFLHGIVYSDSEPKSKEGRLHLTAFFIYTIAACYTHYFACVAAAVIFLFILLKCLKKNNRKRLPGLLVVGGGCIILYLPWILYAVINQLGQVKANYWIPPVSLRTIGGCVRFLFQVQTEYAALNLPLTIILFLFYAVIFLTFLFQHFFQKKENKICETAVLGMGVMAGILIFGLLASILFRPIFVYRYLMPAVGCFWLSFAVMFRNGIGKKGIRFALLILLTVIGLLNFRGFVGEELYKRVHMQETQRVMATIATDDILISNFNQTQAVTSYYLPNTDYLWYEKTEELIQEMYPQNQMLVEEFSDEAGISRLKQVLESGRKVWFLGSGTARDEIISKWKEAGIQAEEEASVMLERYWFNLYTLTLS